MYHVLDQIVVRLDHISAVGNLRDAKGRRLVSAFDIFMISGQVIAIHAESIACAGAREALLEALG